VRIKARMGMSLDGYVATTDGTPAPIKGGGFVPGRSHGYPEFIDGCDTVVMGRQTFPHRLQLSRLRPGGRTVCGILIPCWLARPGGA
jgi:hypothetical protein